MKPDISSVKDSKGAEIVHDGGTVDPVVTLTGTAAPNQQVEVFEGAASRGKHPVDGTGTWTYTATLTAIGTRTFKVKADYGSGQDSVGRILTYSNAVIPAITSVKDSQGVEIPKNTVTLDTSIKLTGTGTPRLEVEILDGAASKGIAQVNATTGKWELEVKNLSLTVHNFKARALYGTGVESAVWTLTVTAATAPTLTSIKGSPSGVEIPQGGNTVETAVTLSGSAAKGQKVEIFDGDVSKGPATADPTTGAWTLLVSALAVAAHSFTAKALYAPGSESAARTLTVIAVGGHEDWKGEPTQVLETNITKKFDSGLELTPLELHPSRKHLINPVIEAGRYEMLLWDQSKTKFRWAGSVTNISLVYREIFESVHKIRFFDSSGVLMDERNLPISGLTAKSFSYQASSGRKVSYFEVWAAHDSGTDHFFIETIRWFN
ncbi:hypothetical protein PS681_01995 [Pseudomonas fluorescens]|nr:hypothetical protein PS681_01995 [Pseudomonas fluorescens]